MTDSTDDFFFAWDGANHPDGPWLHLRVLEARGFEALSRPYEWTLDLVALPGADAVPPEDLVGKRASLRLRTGDDSLPWRLVHGLIGEAEELGEIENGFRYRVVLVPPFALAGMLRKSLIYYKKSIVEIVSATLSRSSQGAGMEDDKGAIVEAPDDGDLSRYVPWTAGFCFRLADGKRAEDPRASWYRVQYEEDDVTFVSRLLEEEGIAYHFEFTAKECVMVLADDDAYRVELPWGAPYGPGLAGRDLERLRVGSRIRPRGYTLTDYSWQSPSTNLMAAGGAGVTPQQVIEHHGNNVWKEFADVLASRREERLHSERTWAHASSRARALGAGAVFHLDHPESRHSGRYLVVEARHELLQRGSFGGSKREPYRAELVCVRGGAGKKDTSKFRPERRTPRPRIHGTQTAIVTGEPGVNAELDIGTSDFEVGSVRVRFHWDIDLGRHGKEPTSCWVRVSQLFAGADHGGLWNPRVGEEVVVAFLDGDPDRPLVVGRVYNGTHRVGMNPTNDPTYSCIKSRTVPEDGSYNLFAFEDQKGKQEIKLEASRDMNTLVHNNQSTTVTHAQSDSAGSISHSSGSTFSQSAKGNFTQRTDADFSTTAAGHVTVTAEATLNLHGQAHAQLHSPATTKVSAGVALTETAGSVIKSKAGGLVVTAAGAAVITTAGGVVETRAPVIREIASSLTLIGNGKALLQGGVLKIVADTIKIVAGGSVSVAGATVNVDGDTVNINGGTVNLNC